MAGKTNRRLITGVLLFIVVALAAAFIGMHFAVRALKSQVEQALGPESEIGELRVGWSAVEIHRLRIKAPKGWPTTDTLRAERIAISPDLWSLTSDRIRVRSIQVDQAYLSVFRTRDGRMRLLPSLLEKPAAGKNGKAGGKTDKSKAEKSDTPPLTIDKVNLSDGVLEFFDATVRQPAHKTRIEQLRASVGPLDLPQLAERTEIDLKGTIKGVQRNGKAALSGWAEIARRNSELKLALDSVDLVAMQPYLIKASETGVKRGTLDLDLKSTVRGNRLRAPGSVTLNHLELVPNGAMSTFMGVPRQAVLGALKDSRDRITLRFTLEGNLDDPNFSLNEDLLMRLGTSIAESMGIGIGGMVKKLFGQ